MGRSKAKKHRVPLWRGKRTLQIHNLIGFVKKNGDTKSHYWEAIIQDRAVINHDSTQDPIVLDRLFIRASNSLVTNGLLNLEPGIPVIVTIDSFKIDLETNEGFMHISYAKSPLEADMEMHIYRDGRPLQIFNLLPLI